jgi:hypothetical protein
MFQLAEGSCATAAAARIVPLHLRRFKSMKVCNVCVHSHNAIKMHAVHSAIVRFDKSLFAPDVNELCFHRSVFSALCIAMQEFLFLLYILYTLSVTKRLAENTNCSCGFLSGNKRHIGFSLFELFINLRENHQAVLSIYTRRSLLI